MRFITETYIKNETVEPVNEVYFGLIKEIQEMIDILHELRVKYIDRPNVGGSYIFYGSNSDPMLNVLATKFESLFGFGVLDLNVVNQSKKQIYLTQAIHQIVSGHLETSLKSMFQNNLT